MTKSNDAALAACLDILEDFKNRRALPSISAGNKSHFAPYTLDGPQVGAVNLLLYVANNLWQENVALRKRAKKLKGSRKHNLKLKLQAQKEEISNLREVQKVVDGLIFNLDPER